MEEFEFTGKQLPADMINQEQMLDFALTYLNGLPDNQDPHEVADQIVTLYIINEFQRDGKETFNAEDITQRFRELLTDHAITTLSNKGLVDVDVSGEHTMLKITPKGQAVVKDNFYGRKDS